MKTSPTGSVQAALWNGRAGRAWVEGQAMLDRMFAPFEAMLVDAAAAVAAQAVLDVGCGTGATTHAIARRLGPSAHCTGVDISQPMVAAARLRAGPGARTDFLCGDAQTQAFAPARFDLLVSRFGVMFFDDPVAAFMNLRRAARPGAELRLIAWRSAEQNPFMTTAERAAAPLLPALPPRQPDAPGQFAFAERDRVEAILRGSGWGGIAIEPIDVGCSLPEADLVRYFTGLGPLGLVLEDADEATRTRLVDTVRQAFDPFVRGDEVRYDAACWWITARSVE
ncbi:class I SAM-dependent methyltransferase [Variovorax sp. UMC13]|uniref:class I SAM-dependent methyltransferase n=1 Tax=Variovorax sp. UMC13 TaxID=1862326 RepID=UPI0015FFDF4E|nr:class I SAM-dependent methyltransferase [Variovorax sp. UMC13]MBB1604771.1 SAM-dependent methyltransferase [Variovorax sp. UMC13]